jgi:glycosyltransferase involved in cell wall biosynthesis
LTDLAVSLAEEGHEVTAVAASSGYDDPGRRFCYREQWKGIDIIRIPGTRFGKASRWRRAVDFGSFLTLCLLRLLTLKSFDVIVAMTSPPLICVLAALLVRLKGGRFVFWVMDLNPDEAIAAGWLRSGTRTERLLETCLRSSLNSAANVVVLDRFMKERVLARGIDPLKVLTIPPWSQDDKVMFDPVARENFRTLHGLANKFVVMYAGNHSPCHPLDTLLDAAHELRECDAIRFVFVGGGSEVGKVRLFAESHQSRNIIQLPYQPLSGLGGVLSAADLHVVILGNLYVGIVHPCKIYNILRVASPVLYIGPPESHVADLASRLPRNVMRSHDHEDLSGVVNSIVDAARNWNRTQRGEALGGEYSKGVLLPRLLDVITGSHSLTSSTAAVFKGEDSWQVSQ